LGRDCEAILPFRAVGRDCEAILPSGRLRAGAAIPYLG